MVIQCNICNKEFSTKGSLHTHQKTAKYCLEKQGKNNEEFNCNFCQKKFTLRHVLQDHLQTCKEKSKKEISKEYESEIKTLNKIINEKDRYYTDQINTLKETIEKLEAKLEKFEDAVIASKKPTSEYEDNSEDIPIPLYEQMSSIIIEEIKEEVEYSNITLNNVVISSRPIDHYVNATQLCQAGGKKFSHWFSLDTTKELLNELASDAGIPASGLVDTKRGGNNKSAQGSWIHPDLSIQLAQWISPKFAIQVSKWIRSLFSEGSVEIDLALLKDKERDMRIKDQRIRQLESVCLSKQRRVEYPERNVIYMLTTEDHLRRRTYIIGKAKNLTSRLGTYNKTCDHTVIHYRECKNEEDMDTSETLILNKLRDYREQANRDRFILPEDKDVSFFTETIDKCISFLG
jgi:cob(I)alamin adenosyltransferase